MSEANYKKSSIIEIVLYLSVIALALGIPLFLGLAGQGFTENFVQGKPLDFGSYLANFLIYVPFLLIGVLCIIFPITRLVIGKRGNAGTKRNPPWYTIFGQSYIASYEENSLLHEIAPKRLAWLKNPLKVFWISLLFFGFYGLLLAGNPQLAVSGVKQLELQQVTPANEVAFNALVPAIAENMVLLFFFMLLMGLTDYILSKTGNKNKWVYYGVGFFVVGLISLGWVGFHSIVYSNSEASLIAVGIFAFMGASLTLLTSSFIPWFVFHLINNTMITLSRVATSKANLLIWSWIIWVILLILTIGITLYRRKVRKKKPINYIPN